MLLGGLCQRPSFFLTSQIFKSEAVQRVGGPIIAQRERFGGSRRLRPGSTPGSTPDNCGVEAGAAGVARD